MGNLDPLLAGIKRVAQDGVILPVAAPPSIVLNAVSPTTITPNSTTGNYDITLVAGGTTSGGWLNSTLGTGGTFDWTAQSTQTFSSDTTVSVGGVTWTTVNTANASPSVNVLNGTGLVITPVSSTQFQLGTARTAPMMMVNLSQVIPGFSFNTPLEISAYWTTGSPAANFDCVFCGLDDGAALQLGFRAGLAFDSGACQQLLSMINGGYITREETTVGLSDTLEVVTWPMGIVMPNANLTSNTGSQTGGVWPGVQFRTNLVGSQYSGGSSWQSDITKYYACFGAQRQGSATNLIATLAAVRIRYR
jgi:hypothetical protein